MSLKAEHKKVFDDPYCGCWDKCKCGGGDKSLILKEAIKDLGSQLSESERKREDAEKDMKAAMDLAKRWSDERDREYREKFKAESRVKELSADCASMREALKEHFHNTSQNCENMMSQRGFCSAESALSSIAGKSLLKRLEAAEKVCEAAEESIEVPFRDVDHVDLISKALKRWREMVKNNP